MDFRKIVSGIAWLPLLGGCMGMGTMGHTGGITAVGYGENEYAAPVQAEASNGELTIGLSLPTPTIGAVVGIDVRLLAASGERDLDDGEVRLRIRTPQGGVDEMVMDRVHSSSGGTYEVRYVFRSAGLYLVTAEAWSVTGADAPAVSVTAQAEVDAHRDRQDWLMPAAIVGGLAMFTMMVVMMAF